MVEPTGKRPARDMRLHVPGDFPGGGGPSTWSTSRLLATVARQVERRWDEELEPHGLSHASLPLLALLAPGPRSQRDLAHALGISEQSVSTMVARLERRGHLSREIDPTHRRRRAVTLTDEGRATLTRVSTSTSLDDVLTRRLSEAETATLRSLLLRAFEPENHG